MLVDNDRDDSHGVRRSLAGLLHDRFEIDHVTLQVDHEVLELISIDMPKPPRIPTQACSDAARPRRAPAQLLGARPDTG